MEVLAGLSGLGEGYLTSFDVQAGGARQNPVQGAFLVQITLNVAQPSLRVVHPGFEAALAGLEFVHVGSEQDELRRELEKFLGQDVAPELVSAGFCSRASRMS
jgi:hypothetical protein